jgi:hypothetical protein
MQHPITQLAHDVRTGQDRQYFWNFVIPAVASLIGNIAGGRSQGKQAASSTALQQDQIANQRYGTQQQATMNALLGASNENLRTADTDLERRKYTLDAPDQRGATAVKGDLMSRAQDVNITHPRATIPTITGGARPSMLSPETRQLGQSMTRNALAQQLAGDTFTDVPQQDWKGGVLTPPQPNAQPTSNWFDKFLSVAGPIAGAAGAVATGQQESQSNDIIQELLKRVMAGQAQGGQTPGGPLGTPPFNPNLGNWQGAS